MSCSRKIVLLLLALILVAVLLPATRERIDWTWANAERHSDSYLNYLGRWPNGSHVEMAKVDLAKTRSHDETKAEMVQVEKLYAMSSRTNSKTRAEGKVDRALKQDDFFWRRAIGANTVSDYNLYLERFPNGKHAVEARQRVVTPGLRPGQQ